MNLLNPRLFNPLHWHLMPLLRDEKIRFIYIEGGSSAAKTAEICSSLLIDQAGHNYSSMVFRRFHVDIKDSVLNSFKTAARRIGFVEHGLFRFQQDLAYCTRNQAKVRFRGLDDEENVKGIEDYDLVYNNEWNQFTKTQWDQQRKRLRGRRNQKFICDWNPVSARLWQYVEWLDLDEWEELPLDIEDAPTKWTALDREYSFKRINKKGNSIWIKVTFRDNFWVVGHPSGEGGFVDQHTLDDYELDRIHNPNLYRVYANGERGIIRTGGEFWKQFNEMKHVKPVTPDSNNSFHVTLDENVNPYVTVSIWQLQDKKIIQVGEIPCKSPDNNAPKAAKKLASYLHNLDFKNVLFVYGDPSAGKRSTIDENNSSFYDKFLEVLRDQGFYVVNRVAKSAPEVALSGAFINSIYESNLDGYEIIIGDNCKVSIDDYTSVKEDKDGKMDKPKVKDKTTGVTYEPQGHFSDAKRYLIIKLLEKEFEKYKSRSKRLRGFSVQ